MEKRGAKTSLNKSWWKQIDDWKGINCLSYKKSTKCIKPQYAIQRLEELTKNLDRYVSTEVGQHQMWAAQFMGFEEPKKMDDFGWSWHYGLWFSCLNWNTISTS